MSEDQESYTPSLDEARKAYERWEFLTDSDEAGAQFDRMIEAVRQEERERAAQIVEGYASLSRAENVYRLAASRIRAAVPTPEPTGEANP